MNDQSIQIASILKKYLKAENDSFLVESRQLVEEFKTSNDNLRDKEEISKLLSSIFTSYLESDYTFDNFYPISDEILSVLNDNA